MSRFFRIFAFCLLAASLNPSCGGSGKGSHSTIVILTDVAVITFPPNSVSDTSNLSVSTTTDPAIFDALKLDASLLGANSMATLCLLINIGTASVRSDSIVALITVPDSLMSAINASTTVVPFLQFRYLNSDLESGEDEAYFDTQSSTFNSDTKTVEVIVPRAAFDVNSGVNVACIVLAVVSVGDVMPAKVARKLFSSNTSAALSPPLPNSLIITDSFGNIGSGRPASHSGVDFRAQTPIPVLSIADGTVIAVDQNARSGKYIIVRHMDGSAASYSHLSSQAVSVSTNVSAGTQVGVSGSTPNVAPHLHVSFGKLGSTTSQVNGGGQSTTYSVVSRANVVKYLVASIEIPEKQTQLIPLYPGHTFTMSAVERDSAGNPITIRRKSGDEGSIVPITAGNLVGASDNQMNANLGWQADTPQIVDIPFFSSLSLAAGSITSDNGQNKLTAVSPGGVVVITVTDSVTSLSDQIFFKVATEFKASIGSATHYIHDELTGSDCGGPVNNPQDFTVFWSTLTLRASLPLARKISSWIPSTVTESGASSWGFGTSSYTSAVTAVGMVTTQETGSGSKPDEEISGSSTETLDLTTGNYTWTRTVNITVTGVCPASYVETQTRTATLPIFLN